MWAECTKWTLKPGKISRSGWSSSWIKGIAGLRFGHCPLSSSIRGQTIFSTLRLHSRIFCETIRPRMHLGLSILWAAPLVALNAVADWPMLHGNPRHDGFVAAEVSPPFRLVWARHFAAERLGTAMEPIVADGLVFIGTHSGNVYALDAASGEPRWRFAAHGAFLQSPSFADGRVAAGSVDGNLYALDGRTGELCWSLFAGYGGFSASPTIASGAIFIGTRASDFLSIDLKAGKALWRQSVAAPIRQTASVAEGRVFVTAEDLRVRAFDAGTGKLLWTSAQLAGQTARDYYPVIVKAGGRTYVIIRTNPVISMGQRIARDRHLLAKNAGVDDSDWNTVDAWTKSEQARGNLQLWEREQKAVIDYLDDHSEARSFFVLDAGTGKEAMTAPVLWIAGCQGVGAMPAFTTDGRLLVFYRSAYGHWNHGVAPLVALGLLDPGGNRITPLLHQSGPQPAWNTFWGTADESQNFVVAGNTVLIVHQGTLSGFGLKDNRLFPIQGERDTYGGLRNLPWARNEWHGPGRGGVAVVGTRLYWITGSRVLGLASGEHGKPAEDLGIDGKKVATQTAPQPASLTRNQIEQRLADEVEQFLSNRWAPLFVDPGLAGRNFSFDNSGGVFEALAMACPHLPGELQRKVKSWLADEWTHHPPFTREAWYSLREGARREWFPTPDEVLSRPGQDKPYHPLGNAYAVWLYAGRCDAWPRVLAAWPQLKNSFNDFIKTGWRLDGAKGDLYGNRYLASLITFALIADKAGDRAAAKQANALAAQTSEGLAAWWKRAADRGTLTTFKGSSELDPFIGGGDAISFRIAPHRHKIALLCDLTPEVAAIVKSKASEAVTKVLEIFQALHPTWSLLGEERQVHYGENFVDPPELALDAFKAMAWLNGGPRDELRRRIDLPFCRADLHYLTKLAIALDAAKATGAKSQ
ncbi:MAG: hypothetical protein DME19_10520 [Verrucomicrobia bacterium]|nr:MAG: hypothetical protein DME19_10520 [Verrucomicrobiota bacterium]